MGDGLLMRMDALVVPDAVLAGYDWDGRPALWPRATPSGWTCLRRAARAGCA
jgi:hypothetical protein